MLSTSAQHTIPQETVVATFHSHTEAQQAIGRLKNAGLADQQIDVLSQDSSLLASCEIIDPVKTIGSDDRSSISVAIRPTGKLNPFCRIRLDLAPLPQLDGTLGHGFRED